MRMLDEAKKKKRRKNMNTVLTEDPIYWRKGRTLFLLFLYLVHSLSPMFLLVWLRSLVDGFSYLLFEPVIIITITPHAILCFPPTM
jgi:hypothetical protein